MGSKASLSNSKKIEFNPSKPTTSIRVSFANGKKTVIKLNQDHTVCYNCVHLFHFFDIYYDYCYDEDSISYTL